MSDRDPPIGNDRPANLSLIGYRATGKSTTAAALATRLSEGSAETWHVIDTDAEIQRRAARSIANIFQEDGEPAFRDLETQVLADLLPNQTKCIFSLGGGAILRESNRTLIARHSTPVWLQATPEEIWRRMQGDAVSATQRPSLTDLNGFNEIKAVLTERLPLYQNLGQLAVDTEGKSLEMVVDEIVRQLAG